MTPYIAYINIIENEYLHNFVTIWNLLGFVAVCFSHYCLLNREDLNIVPIPL